MHVTDQNFKTEVLESHVPVLVDFFANWCGPCQMLSPIIEELAKEYEGKAKICSLDVEQNLGTSREFGIQALPTIYIFKNGQAAFQKVGFMSKEDLKEALDKLL